MIVVPLAEIINDAQLDSSVRLKALEAMEESYWPDMDDRLKVIAFVLRGRWDELDGFGATAVGTLRDAVADGEPEVKRQAAQALAGIESPAARDALLTAFNNRQEDSGVRRIAARTLARSGDPRLIETLVAAAPHDSPDVRQTIVQALAEAGWKPGDDRDLALVALSGEQIEDDAPFEAPAVDRLLAEMGEAKEPWEAAKALARIRPAGVEALIELCRDPAQGTTLREAAIMALSEVGEEFITPMLKDKDPTVRQVGVRMLQRLGWKPASDEERAVVALANEQWEELAALGPAAVDLLVKTATETQAVADAVSALERHSPDPLTESLEFSSAACPVLEVCEAPCVPPAIPSRPSRNQHRTTMFSATSASSPQMSTPAG